MRSRDPPSPENQLLGGSSAHDDPDTEGVSPGTQAGWLRASLLRTLATLSHLREAGPWHLPPKAGLWGEGKPGCCLEEVCSVLGLQAHPPPLNLASRRKR